MPVIRTPETDPKHHTIGLCFKAWDGLVYYCDSHEANHGYWMTRVDTPEDHLQDREGEYRRNVSERAINGTFWPIRKDGDFMYCQYGPVKPHDLGRFAGTGRYANEFASEYA